MIIEVRAKNCFAFKEEICFSLKADMRNKKFASNVCTVGNFNVLKTAGIYGPNNAGKTNLVRCVFSIWSVLSNKGFSGSTNFFSNNSIVELGVSFLHEAKEFSYDFKYDIAREEYVYERFDEVIKDSYGNERIENWLLRDVLNNRFETKDLNVVGMIGAIARNNILIHLVDTSQFQYMAEIKRILEGLAQKIDIIDMNNIPLNKTIELLKNKDSICDKVTSFIKNADLYMDDFYFADEKNIKIEGRINTNRPQENVLNIPDQLIEQMRLTSVYRGVSVPSLIVDSTGTKKIVALASYIIEALEKGRILIVDELDSSLHFKLTRAVVAMFNNELNTTAQMIFTVHDINLMDCRRLFRKEQIWFVQKDEEGIYLYSLADFTAKDGVRDTSDIIEKYRKGLFGALPEPELINSLLEIKTLRAENEQLV